MTTIVRNNKDKNTTNTKEKHQEKKTENLWNKGIT